MIYRRTLALPLCLLSLALLAARPCAAVNLAINYSDGNPLNALRLAENGSPQPSYATSGEQFVSFAADPVTGLLYGLGRSGGSDVLRVWDNNGAVVRSNPIDYTQLGLSASASAASQPSPDIAVHNGVVAINYSDAFNIGQTPLRITGANTAALGYSTFATPASKIGLGLLSLDFDQNGQLYALGQYAFSDFNRQEDFIRVWDNTGALSGGDVMFDYSSVGLGATATAGAFTSPDIAVHGGNIAINFNDEFTNPRSILHLDTAGAALAPYAAPFVNGFTATGYLDLDYDHATGDLYALGQYAGGSFNRQEDFIGKWALAGGLSTEEMFNYASIGLAGSDTAGLQPSPDLVVVPEGPSGNIFAGDYNNDCVVDAADYTVWRDNLGMNVTLPNDVTPGTVDPSDYVIWRENYGASKFAPMNPDGDFNDDGVVDAADYTVWRDNQGLSVSLPNDNGLGTPIGPAHYNLWRTNYGSLAAGPLPTPGASAAPEPAAAMLALLFGLGASARRRR